jgi:AraC-like DNA-binding protein
MAHNDNVLRLNTIPECNDYLGVATMHPLVSVVELGTLPRVQHQPKRLGIYAIACFSVVDKQSGRNTCAMSFFPPGSADPYYEWGDEQLVGWILMFDVMALSNTLMANRMSEYPFFAKPCCASLSLSEDEYHTLTCCMRSIQQEVVHGNDVYSEHILASGIAVLLSVCMRYYDRQHHISATASEVIMQNMNSLLNGYLIISPKDREVPTVASLASQLHISANYLGDVVRKQMNCSAHDYIRQFVVREAKRLLRFTSLSIGEVGYMLGYKYPHHFTRVFKSEEGVTPYEYRQMSQRQ